MQTDPSLSLVNLIEPHLCETCRFAQHAIVTKQDGRRMRVIRCMRLDCDNWDRSHIEPVQSVVEVNDRE